MLNPDMKLQSIEAVKRSVMNNLGIASVPQFSVEEELKNGSLLRLGTKLDDKPYPEVVVFHKNRRASPQMELAFRILREQIEVNYSQYKNNANGPL